MAMAMLPPSAAGVSVTTIDCLKDENIEEILLRLLLLDTATMKFSVLPLPASVVIASGPTVFDLLGRTSSYAVGETAYGACCLACVDVVRAGFQVWVLAEDSAGGRRWELDKDMDERKLVAQRPQGYNIWCEVSVTSVVAGVAVVAVGCHDVKSYSGKFIVDLTDLSIKASFLCCEPGYPVQLPWPPLGLAPAAYTNCDEKNMKKAAMKRKRSNEPPSGPSTA